MIIFDYILIGLGLLLVAYILDMYHTYIDNKRMLKEFESIQKERAYQQLLDKLRYISSYDPSDAEYDDIPDVSVPIDTVEILPREPVFNKAVYLQSQQWKDIRKVILKRDNYTCRKCHEDNIPLEIHHITYARLGHEDYSDLVALCRTCHQSIHDKHGYDYYSTFPIGD